MEVVTPTTVITPELSRNTPLISSPPLPPRNVDHTSPGSMVRVLVPLHVGTSKPKLEGPKPDNEADCKEASGQWGLFGLYQVDECNLPTPDVGRICTGSVECVNVSVLAFPSSPPGIPARATAGRSFGALA